MVKKERTLLTAMILGLSLLLLLRDLAGISMSKFIFLGYIVAFMAVAQYKTLVYMLCFIMPLVCGLPGTYIMPCALMLLILKRGRLDLRRFWMICAVLTMELFAALWYPRLDLISIVQYVSFAGVMIYLIYDKTDLDYQKCVQMFFLGVVFLNFVIIISGILSAPGDWMTRFAKGWFRFGATHTDENSGMTLSLNSNSMAYYSVVGTCCGLVLMERTDGRRRLWYLLLTMFCGAGGFLSVSVAWALVTVGCLGLYIISKLSSPRKLMLLLITLSIMAAVALVFFRKNPEIWQGMLTRLTSEDVKDGNGRMDALRFYMDALLSNPRWLIFGAGVTQYINVIKNATAMHNGTQQILVCCGLVGFAIYMIILSGAVLKARGGKRLPMVYWLPLISCVVFVQSIQFLNPMMLMLPYAIGVMALKIQNNTKTSEKSEAPRNVL